MARLARLANKDAHALERAVLEDGDLTAGGGSRAFAVYGGGGRFAAAAAAALTGERDAESLEAGASSSPGLSQSGTRPHPRPRNRSIWTLLGVTVPETTMVRLEILFLRTHNVSSASFDFCEYVESCVAKNSEEALGMSPGRWFFAAAMILAWGPLHEINTFVSVLSLFATLTLSLWIRFRLDVALDVERRGVGTVDDRGGVFLCGVPRLADDVFVAVLYQQSFHLAGWIFGLWTVGLGGGENVCYYGVWWSVWLSVATVATCAALGGYVVLPMHALASQMSSGFRADLMGDRTSAVMQGIMRQLARKRTGNVRAFASDEEAVVFIQRAFRARKRTYFQRAARAAMIAKVATSKEESRSGRGGKDAHASRRGAGEGGGTDEKGHPAGTEEPRRSKSAPGKIESESEGGVRSEDVIMMAAGANVDDAAVESGSADAPAREDEDRGRERFERESERFSLDSRPESPFETYEAFEDRL